MMSGRKNHHMTTGVRSASASPHSSPAVSRKGSPKPPFNSPKPSPKGKDNTSLNVTDIFTKVGRFEHQGTDNCPCGGSKPSSWKIDCSKCSQMWHVDCVTLDGISKDSISKMLNYLCPFCYVPPVPAPRTAPSPYVCHTCINTTTVRDINQWSAIDSLSSKLESIKSLDDSLSHIQTLDLHIKHLLLDNEPLKDYHNRLSSIEENLANFTSKLDQFTNKVMDQNTSTSNSSNTDAIFEKIDNLLNQSPTTQQPVNSATSHDSRAKITHNITHNFEPISMSRDNYIDAASAAELDKYLSSQADNFTAEGDREVISFGEPYHYNGSSSKPKEFPAVIKNVLDKINSELCNDSPKMNSCLINKYSGTVSSLPPHSDNELCIAPDSSIYTVCLGDSCVIKFNDLHTGKRFDHTCTDRSLYVMPRSSQDFFDHSMQAGQITNVRYSLTFRCVGWRYMNSTIVIGDSNTGKLKFGEEKGTFGKATPGCRVWAPTIDKIDPIDTAGYSNVVILCGINDVKQKNISSKSDVYNVYSALRLKIEMIHCINPKAHIFVCPLLPSRLFSAVEKINDFNSHIFDDLQFIDYNISIVQGFHDFVGDNHLLASRYSRGEGDYLHLNVNGINVLANKIKTHIFDRKKGRSRMVTPNCTFARAAQRPPAPS